MKCQIPVALLLALGSLATAQNPPSSPPNQPDKQRQQRQALQRKIDRLERQLAAPLAEWEKTNLPDFSPRTAHILNINGNVDVITCARNGLQTGDMLLVVRYTDKGRIIVGKVRVSRAYDTDAEADVVSDYAGIRPEDDVYVLNRIGSPHSLRWALW
jgi:hypothetical protein